MKPTHFHGSTAVQISSGMAGALIIEGGANPDRDLDQVPVIAGNRGNEKIFVLQQFAHDVNGELESFSLVDHNRPLGRPVMVNGQFMPTIRMRPGEVQRWRFVHAGVQENLKLSLQRSDGAGQPVKLHEIAADGLPLGRIVSWPGANPADDEHNLVLGPGYRSDVLVQFDQPGTYALRDLPFSNTRNSIQASLAAALGGAAGQRPASTIAVVEVGGATASAVLPTDGELSGRVPPELAPIEDQEIGDAGQPRQALAFTMGWRRCFDDGSCDPASCSPNPGDFRCRPRFMVNDMANIPGPVPANDRVYTPGRQPRTLRLNRASEWVLTGTGVRHPFHIHVNPFQMERREPNAAGQLDRKRVWKDTVLLPIWGERIALRSRQTVHTGKFVLHCHILSHEDQGMMEDVEIIP